MGSDSDLVGFRAVGRNGDLGVVVAEDAADEDHVVVRGGVSDSLVYRVPAGRIRDVLKGSRVVVLDADLTDFVPWLQDDGSVELRLPGS